MYKTKLRAVGKSTGIILPKELLDRMNLKAGDELIVRETRAGYVIERDDEAFRRQLEAAREGMSKYRNALKALAE